MSYFEKECGILTEEQMTDMKTRQLLAHLRRTYRWGEYYWDEIDYEAKRAYQTRVKTILATREHIPNKQESKRIRIARKKKGN